MNYTIIGAGVLAACFLASCGTQTNAPTNSSGAEDISSNSQQETMNTELTGTVVLDLNHPLAGKTLNFEVEIVNITKGEGNTQADTVESGDDVEVHYVGTLEDGEQFDSSRDRGETLPFSVGAGQMIAGFDSGVVGMKLGESKNLTIPAEEAYGAYDDSLKQEVPASQLAPFVNAGYDLEVGAVLPTQFGQVKIVEIKE